MYFQYSGIIHVYLNGYTVYRLPSCLGSAERPDRGRNWTFHLRTTCRRVCPAELKQQRDHGLGGPSNIWIIFDRKVIRTFFISNTLCVQTFIYICHIYIYIYTSTNPNSTQKGYPLILTFKQLPSLYILFFGQLNPKFGLVPGSCHLQAVKKLQHWRRGCWSTTQSRVRKTVALSGFKRLQPVPNPGPRCEYVQEHVISTAPFSFGVCL